MNVTHRLVAGVLAASLLMGAGVDASAAAGKAKAKHSQAYGQVSNLSATGFTLTRTSKKAGVAPAVVQVTLTTTTKEKARKGTTGTLADGEYAFVIGAKSGSTIAAKRVLFSAKAFNAKRLVLRIKAQRIAHRLSRGRAIGTVNAASTTATSLVITTAKGKTLSFTITPKTKYRVDKQAATTAPVLTNGEKVRVLFSRDPATKTRIARVIVVTITATTQL